MHMERKREKKFGIVCLAKISISQRSIFLKIKFVILKIKFVNFKKIVFRVFGLPAKKVRFSYGCLRIS